MSGAGEGCVALAAAAKSDGGLSGAALSCDLPTWEGVLMGCRKGEADGVDREEEREESEDEVRREAVEGEDEGVVGGVSILSLDFAWSEFDAMREDDGEPCRERSGLRVGDGEGEGFGVSCGSIAEKVKKCVSICRI